MIPLLQLNRKLTYLFIAVLLGCFAVAQSARAVSPEPEGGDSNGNMAEEETAYSDLITGATSTAAGQQATQFHPNRRGFRFIFQNQPLQCAGGNVTIKGEVVITFQNNVQRRVLKPRWIRVEGFNGSAWSGDRTLKVTSVDLKDVSAGPVCGCGTFKIEMIVTGPPLPGGRPLKFKVLFGPNEYTFQNGLVTGFMPDRTPKVVCINP